MRVMIILIIAVFFGPFKSLSQAYVQSKAKPKLIVLTDITSVQAGVREPDDAQSMIRLMLYSNEFDIEGLIASSGLIHGQVTRPQNIRKIVNAYGKIWPNLLLHNSGYPAPKKLRQVIKSGQPIAGRDVPVFKSIGKGKNTQASKWIIQKVDETTDKCPIWIVIWGGSADLAQALWKVRETRSPAEVARFIAKIRVIASYDQDSTGPWIKSQFPDLYYATKRTGIRGFYRGGDTSLVSSAWVQQNIKGHGALGDLYPDYNGGDIYTHKLGKVKGIKGGDTPTYLGLFNNGLNPSHHLTWENWGGRMKQDPAYLHHYVDAIDSVGSHKMDLSPYWSVVYRWRSAFQADFQAHMDWCIQPYSKANHAPDNKNSYKGNIPKKRVKAGKKIMLQAGNWSDPDGNNLAFHWHMLPEESSYPKALTITHASSKSAYFVAPSVEKPRTIHVLLTVADDGQPSLHQYQRFNFTITPDK